MIEEQGRVLSVEEGAVWVETVRRSTCGSCQARAGCGQALLQRLGSGARQGFIRVIADREYQVGDEIVIGIPEDAVVRGSLWVYVVPLIGLFASGSLAGMLGMSEPATIAAAFTGLFAGFGAVRWHSRRSVGDPSLQPRVLRPQRSTVVQS
ncbi:transcriptional regulator [Pseudomonas sp. gcc21]|uniref:SoxR reducing system RseC family protein n=1 Tax=Pseudomonas sp. gcc21 TaxID=2726989 RepID=UPI0014527415|nr:SoxR reducing system RseC family protein [Pseudomonas sp. gcc21]QJD60551.1 transcriptional regulator [Pseudomonas sp. gcc21]